MLLVLEPPSCLIIAEALGLGVEVVDDGLRVQGMPMGGFVALLLIHTLSSRTASCCLVAA
ncbi:MAG: hypothetical protein WD079_07065 [Phycisphaeraceae bacterium]